jgi:uncharacterized protein (TIGR02001 family)
MYHHVRKLVMVFAVVPLVFVGAITTASAVEVHGDAYIAPQTKYLTRGVNFTPDSDAVIESGMDLYIGNWAFGYWSIYDVDSEKQVETDLFFDYSYQVNDLVSVGIGNVFYNIIGYADTNEAVFTVKLHTLLNPTFKVHWDWDEAEEDGLWYLAEISHEFEIKKNLTLDVSAQASYNQRSDIMVGNYNAWHHAEGKVALNYIVNDQFILTPFVRVSTALSDDAEKAGHLGDGEESVMGLTAYFHF